MAPRHPNRPQYRTLLLVGEGETEQAFLQHVKKLYVQRGSGLKVTVRCLFLFAVERDEQGRDVAKQLEAKIGV